MIAGTGNSENPLAEVNEILKGLATGWKNRTCLLGQSLANQAREQTSSSCIPSWRGGS